VLFVDPDAPQRIREQLSVVQPDDERLSERLLAFRVNAVA
jgi:hypothetical protein